MPSAEHEPPIALAKLDPSMVAWLLANIFDIKLPDYHHIRTHATDVRVMVPRTYHADSMVLFCDPADRLEARGITVPDTVREQILACTDLTKLDTWLRRAITAATAEEVVKA